MSVLSFVDMNVSPFVNLAVSNDVAELSIVGDIGYNIFAENEEDYKKNTSENIANELNAIKEIEAKTINVTLESLGGDLSHALAIYNLLKQNEANVNTYLRGANASSSTIIASAADSVDNIFMDTTGLYLIHKPMTWADGNANDMKQAAKDLDKWQKALEQAYVGIGVEQEVLDKLMERNGGHGEWLTFDEAKEYGFVGNEWKTKKVSNYRKPDFINRGLLTPDKFINEKRESMANTDTIVLNEEQEKGLFSKFKAWFKNETEVEELEKAKAKELEDLKAELEEANAKIAELEKVEEVAEVEETDATAGKTEEEVAEVKEEVNVGELIEAKFKEVVKNLAEPTSSKKKEVSNSSPSWKKDLENFKKLSK